MADDVEREVAALSQEEADEYFRMRPEFFTEERKAELRRRREANVVTTREGRLKP